jgi:hypothetical protein
MKKKKRKEVVLEGEMSLPCGVVVGFWSFTRKVPCVLPESELSLSVSSESLWWWWWWFCSESGSEGGVVDIFCS